MREIKFRVWSKYSEKMFEEGFYLSLNNELFQNDCLDYKNKDSFEIMQYTGLKDKNGKEIYEGDILKITCNFELRDGVEIDVVRWSDGCVSFACSDWLLYELAANSNTGEQNFEVIGNIYENKEML